MTNSTKEYFRHKADRIYQRGVQSMWDAERKREGSVKLALVTTTINVPEVLKLYRDYGPDVQMFVAGDDKTPREVSSLCFDNGWQYCAPEADDAVWKCSKLLGRNTIGRRSIAILEALKWSADVIVSIDDDNIPMEAGYFDHFRRALMPSVGWSGLQAVVNQGLGWFDVGQLLVPPARHRGFPYEWSRYRAKFNHVIDVKIGVAAGICLGDPDISAVTRIANEPVVHQVSEILKVGCVVCPSNWAVFNSQNTAFLRELAPCFLMVPQFGRFDDIFASLIAQRVMRETKHRIHFGRPFVWQQRNDHNLLTDLKAEMWGMEHVVEFADWLDAFEFYGSVLDRVRHVYTHATDFAWMPEGVTELGLAWCDDCESVL